MMTFDEVIELRRISDEVRENDLSSYIEQIEEKLWQTARRGDRKIIIFIERPISWRQAEKKDFFLRCYHAFEFSGLVLVPDEKSYEITFSW